MNQTSFVFCRCWVLPLMATLWIEEWWRCMTHQQPWYTKYRTPLLSMVECCCYFFRSHTPPKNSQELLGFRKLWVSNFILLHLSQRICQDPLEKFLALRGRGEALITTLMHRSFSKTPKHIVSSTKSLKDLLGKLSWYYITHLST